MEGVIPLSHPIFRVKMSGKDVIAVLTPYLLSVSYTDFEEGQADTLDIRVEDVDGRFRDRWYPAKGQTLELEFGYEGEPLQRAGLFEVDEIEGEGPPDVVSIRAIAAGVSIPQRTSQARAYENTTLAAIAQQVARRSKLKLVGKIEPINIARITQIHEPDLTFLRRLATEYGYAFSVKGSRMVFFRKADLRGGKTILTLDRADLTRYHLRDKLMGVPAAARVSYYDAKTKRLNHYAVTNTDRAASADQVRLNVRAETEAQAKTKAQAALDDANAEATQLELTVMGNPRLVAGVNFALTGMGRFGGAYHVVKSRHDFTRGGGYATNVEAKRVTRG